MLKPQNNPNPNQPHRSLARVGQPSSTSTSSSTERFPVSFDAERLVLGLLILDSGLLWRSPVSLGVKDFFFDNHATIFRALLAMCAERKPIELASLTEYLHDHGELERAEGAGYLANLIDGLPRSMNFDHYATILREKTVLRKVVRLMNHTQERVQGGESHEGVLTELARSVLELMSEQGRNAMPMEWRDSISDAVEKIAQGIRAPEKVMRLMADIPKLDDLTAGFRRDELELIVGETSHGKSTLAQQIAVAADNRGYQGLIFSAEMSAEALVTRELAHTSGVPLFLLRRPEKIYNPKAVIEKLTAAAAEEAKRSLLIVDQDITPARIQTTSEMIHRTRGLDFVIVDYDQLVVREALSRGENEFAEQARFVTEALALAKRLHLCFILLCQPRKVDVDVATGKRAPRIADVFGHGAVGNTAHCALWVVRKFFQKQMKVEHEGEATVYVLKARNDKAGHVDIGFDPDKVLFVNDPPPSEVHVP